MLRGEEPVTRTPQVPAVVMPEPEALIRTPQVRRRYILKQDVARYGPTPGCEACTALAGGAQRVTKPHADECRRRMDELMQRDEDALVQQRLHADRLRRGSTVADVGTLAPATEMVGSDLPTGRGEEITPQVSKTTESTRTAQGDVDMGTDGSRMRGLKRPAETELDDGMRTSPNTDSTEHFDGDVPVIAPTVQQAEQAADAADAYMSVGKMEMIKGSCEDDSFSSSKSVD